MNSKIIKKLYEYENTGLSPEEIEKLKSNYQTLINRFNTVEGELWSLYSLLGVEAFGEDIYKQAREELVKLILKDKNSQ